MNTKRLGRPTQTPAVRKRRQREAKALVAVALRELGCTPAGLAGKLGVSENSVRSWQGGRHGMSNVVKAAIDNLLRSKP